MFYTFDANDKQEPKIIKYQDHYELSFGSIDNDEYTKKGFRCYGKTKEITIESLHDSINKYVEDKIINGLVWSDIKIYCSKENQQNWKTVYDYAVQTTGDNLPVTLKLGENEDGSSVYYTFGSRAEMKKFMSAMFEHILSCLQEGWSMKDELAKTNFIEENG